MTSFSVRVVDDDGKPVSGVKVVLEFTSILRGMSPAHYTDSAGYASFEDYEEGDMRVYINGSNYGTYYYRDRDEITLTL